MQGVLEMRTVAAFLVLIACAAMLLAETQPAKAVLRRLTHSQYNNTVRDLLGDQTRPADAFPEEDFVNGFRNQIAAQDISPLLAEAYNTAAERLAKSAFLGGVGHQSPDSLQTDRSAGCADSFRAIFWTPCVPPALDRCRSPQVQSGPRAKKRAARATFFRAHNSSLKRCCNRRSFCSGPSGSQSV